MATGQVNSVLHYFRRAALLQDGGGMTDGQLLERFLTQRDEAAFEALVRRHGLMVWGVCRRVLHHLQDAEDAFQATFFVLARKAASITRRESVGSWLYGAAYRAALEARAARRPRERQVNTMPEPVVVTEVDIWRDLRPLLDQELSRLPDKYREAIVLCDLEGKTRKEAARQVGVPEGTLSGRLTTARRMLAGRLGRHGLALSGGALVTALSSNAVSAGVPAALIDSTTKAVIKVTAGTAAAVVPAKVTAIMEGVLKTMLLSKLKVVPILLVVVTLTVFGIGYLADSRAVARLSADKKVKEPPSEKKEAPKDAPKWDVRAALEGHTDSVWAVTFSRDGKVLATASRDGTVRLYEAATGKVLATLAGHQGDVHRVAFAPDGKTVVTAGEDKTVRVWDLATKQEVQRVVHNDPVRGASFTPDGRTLIGWGGVHDPKGGDGRAEIRLWDPATGKEREALSQLPKTRVEDVLITPDTKVLITSSGNTFTFWDWNGKAELKERRSLQADESHFIYGMALAPDGKILAVTTDATVKLYDVATGQQRDELEKSLVNCWDGVIFSPDGKTVTAHMVIEEKDGDWVVQRRTMFRLWDVATGKVRETFHVEAVIRSAAFARDGKTLAVGCRGAAKFKVKEGDIIDLATIEEETDGAVKLLERK
jgi:RNA polymerase sigma factor (sigma-70 family)